VGAYGFTNITVWAQSDMSDSMLDGDRPVALSDRPAVYPAITEGVPRQPIEAAETRLPTGE